VTIPVTGLPPSELALAWRPGADHAVRDFVDAAREVTGAVTDDRDPP